VIRHALITQPEISLRQAAIRLDKTRWSLVDETRYVVIARNDSAELVAAAAVT